MFCKIKGILCRSSQQSQCYWFNSTSLSWALLCPGTQVCRDSDSHRAALDRRVYAQQGRSLAHAMGAPPLKGTEYRLWVQKKERVSLPRQQQWKFIWKNEGFFPSKFMCFLTLLIFLWSLVSLPPPQVRRIKILRDVVGNSFLQSVKE